MDWSILIGLISNHASSQIIMIGKSGEQQGESNHCPDPADRPEQGQGDRRRIVSILPEMQTSGWTMDLRTSGRSRELFGRAIWGVIPCYPHNSTAKVLIPVPANYFISPSLSSVEEAWLRGSFSFLAVLFWIVNITLLHYNSAQFILAFYSTYETYRRRDPGHHRSPHRNGCVDILTW